VLAGATVVIAQYPHEVLLFGGMPSQGREAGSTKTFMLSLSKQEARVQVAARPFDKLRVRASGSGSGGGAGGPRWCSGWR